MESNRKKYYFISDHKVIKVHEFLYVKYKYYSIFASLILYVLPNVLWSESLLVAGNYLIILPLLTFAFSFGFKGGLLAGILALPLNYLLFYLTGHLEHLPLNIPIAEIAGIFIGAMLGYGIDFFNLMKKEINRRRISEIALEKTVREKEILLHEINHRVKNNLNLIKSIIQLQANRIRSKKQQEELQKLTQRIISIAMVQDLLFTQDSIDMLDIREYLNELIRSLLNGYNKIDVNFNLIVPETPLYLESGKLTSLGLIVNEIVTNTVKYAFHKQKKPRLYVQLSELKGYYILKIKDNGPGFPDEFPESGLGLKLIRTLTSHLGGTIQFSNNDGGEIQLNIPIVYKDLEIE